MNQVKSAKKPYKIARLEMLRRSIAMVENCEIPMPQLCQRALFYRITFGSFNSGLRPALVLSMCEAAHKYPVY
jgi:hypothetical protein